MSGRRAIILVAEREIRERLRSKAFLISTLVILLVVGGSTALGGALSKETTYRVAVTAPAPPGLAVALQRPSRSTTRTCSCGGRLTDGRTAGARS